MCDPLTLAITVGTMAASYGAKSMGQQAVNRARSSAQDAEFGRQRQLDQELYAVNDQSRDRYNDAQRQTESNAQDLAAFYKQTGEAGSQPNLLPASDSTITTAETDRQKGKARAFTDQQADSRANLRGFGDFLSTAGLGVQRDTGQAQTVAGFKRGSAAVLPYELEDANGAGAGWNLLGDVLAGAGQIGTSALTAGSIVNGATAAGKTIPARGVGMFGRLGPI